MRQPRKCWWCGGLVTRLRWGREICNRDECYHAAKERSAKEPVA